VEEFTAKFGPSHEDYDAVIGFAETNGFTVVGTHRNRLNVDVTGSVASIEKAFHLTMGVYQHPTEKRTFYAPDREPTPDLAVRLWHIFGLDNYSIPHPAFRVGNPRAKSNATAVGPQPPTPGSGPSKSFLGSDMRAAYYGGTLTGSGQSLGLFEVSGTDLADLRTYYKNVGQTYPSTKITLLSTDGTSTSCFCGAKVCCNDTEPTLDMTQALGMAPGLSSLVMYIGSNTDPEDGATIFEAMAEAEPLNRQLSCSYFIPIPAANRNENDIYFQEFALQGQNLFSSSDDDGVWSTAPPPYPSDDVYVTSVGGTMLETSAGGAWSSETAWPNGGGGVSPFDFPIPPWQTATATGCIALGVDQCSGTYRNGPDVSANANGFYVCSNQTTCITDGSGTSFAAPMWAGFLALANEQQANNGKPSLRSLVMPYR
jgi:subtilase family serine protease